MNEPIVVCLHKKIHAELMLQGFTHEHTKANYQETGGPENGPEVSGHEAFDTYEKIEDGIGLRIFVTEKGAEDQEPFDPAHEEFYRRVEQAVSVYKKDKQLEIATIEGWLVYCSTGCTCCSNENHYCGPFRTKKEADEACEHYASIKKLSSQYAERGVYTPEQVTVEELSHDRLLIDGERVAQLGWGDFQLWSAN